MDARKMLWELPRDVFAQSHVIWVFASALSLFVTTSVQVVLHFGGEIRAGRVLGICRRLCFRAGASAEPREAVAGGAELSITTRGAPL